MAVKKLLIDLQNIDMNEVDTSDCTDVEDILSAVITYLSELPIVDAVPVDEIRVDFVSICLENQEAVLDVSVCGKPNEVKLPLSKDVAEVVHGRWEKSNYHGFLCCSECKDVYIDKTWFGSGKWNYCPNCGARMGGEGNG